jgi:hypothetical protein
MSAQAQSRMTLIGLAAAALLAATPAWGQRYVVVNGERMSEAQIQGLERLRCAPIPNGLYWLNPGNGVWGYAGNPVPQGHISDPCRQTARRPSLSERGMLFGPSDYWR